MSDEYTPPEVWQWEGESGGKFAKINRPVAGPTHERQLPRGKHPLQLYSLGTPNGQKVTILLEELLERGHDGAQYDAWYIDIGEGEQFGSGFVSVNPNSKVPALLDVSVNSPVRIFESGAILLYLAERFGELCPAGAERAEVLSWLFWQVASTPYLGGGFGHFYAYAPKKWRYPIDRYAMETKRQLDVLDRVLTERPYVAGGEYSIADIAIFPWYGALVLGELYNAAEFLAVAEYKNVLRWARQMAGRPAVRRGRLINRSKEADAVRERH